MKKKLSLMELYVYIEQSLLLIPLLYIFVVSGSYYQIMSINIITITFEFGMSFLPRIIMWLSSIVYHSSMSEIVMYFAMAFLSLIIGLIASKTILNKYNDKLIYHDILIGFNALDIILRLLPLSFNNIFYNYVDILALIFRIICLVLIIYDRKRKGVA